MVDLSSLTLSVQMPVPAWKLTLPVVNFRNILGTVREDAEPSFVPAFPDNLKTAGWEIASRCRRL
jgi:hypothetical protein